MESIRCLTSRQRWKPSAGVRPSAAWNKANGSSSGSIETQDGTQRFVHRPQFLDGEMTDSFAEALSIDGPELFDENFGCVTGDFDLRAKRCRTDATRRRRNDDDGSRQKSISLNDDTEAFSGLFVSDTFGNPESVHLTSAHASTP